MSEDSRVVAAREYLDGSPDPKVAELIEGVIAAYDERLRVNVGLLRESVALRRELRQLNNESAQT